MVTLDRAFSKKLLQLFVQELHNNLVSDPEDSGIEEAIDVENNIIISDYTFHSLLLTPQKISTLQGPVWL